jgi:O-antigen ligase
MTARSVWIALPVALVGCLALVPLFVRPELALGLGVVAVIVLLAWRSVAYAVALAAVPPILFGIFGSNPLPEGVVGLGVSAGVVLSMAAAIHRRESVPPPRLLTGLPVLLSVFLLCLLVVRLPPAPDTNYGEIKSAFFVINNLVFLIGGIFVGWSAARVRQLFVAILTISVGGAVLLVLDVAGGGVHAILPVALTFSEGDHSISMGRQMGAGALIALAIVLGREDAPGRLVAAAALPLLVAALLASGARGPIVALLAAAMVLLALGLTDRIARRRLIALVAATAVTVLLIPGIVPEASLVRSFSFVSTDVESASSGRTEMWRQAWHAISDRPEAGVGTGGFAEINPPMIYPHNLVLEVGVELGLAGVLLVAAFLVHAALRIMTAYRRGPPRDRLMAAAVMGLFTAAVTNAMLSYAIHGNWEVWLWAGVGTALAARVLAERAGGTPEPASG